MTRERLAAREHAASAFPAASGRARVRVYQTVSKPRLTGIGIEIGPGRGADTHFAVAPVSLSRRRFLMGAANGVLEDLRINSSSTILMVRT